MANRSPYQTIRRRSDFLDLQKRGAKVYPQPWMVMNFQENSMGQLRCGWTFPKYVGPAVVRNRLKRWSREFFRRQGHGVLAAPQKTTPSRGLDINIVLRRQSRDFYRNVSHSEFEATLEKGLLRIQKRYGGNP